MMMNAASVLPARSLFAIRNWRSWPRTFGVELLGLATFPSGGQNSGHSQPSNRAAGVKI